MIHRQWSEDSFKKVRAVQKQDANIADKYFDTVFSVAVCRRNLTGYSKISGKVHCKYCFYANCHWITNKMSCDLLK